MSILNRVRIHKDSRSVAKQIYGTYSSLLSASKSVRIHLDSESYVMKSGGGLLKTEIRIKSSQLSSYKKEDLANQHIAILVNTL